MSFVKLNDSTYVSNEDVLAVIEINVQPQQGGSGIEAVTRLILKNSPVWIDVRGITAKKIISKLQNISMVEQ